MDQWEYCYIAIQTQGVRGNIIWAQPDGLRVQELVLDARAGDENTWDMAHRAMARLGTEGWELTGLMTHEHTARWYFKRRRPETTA